VAEFIGNGITSRAIIQKGALTLIHRSTIAGHFAFILDENKCPCKPQKGGGCTGLYFDSVFYPAADGEGRIVIPFGRHTYKANGVIVHDGFAQLVEFERESEQYSFEASFILLSESLVMGNTARLLIKPSLILNKR
jgi:hypothetical protein